MKKAYSRWKQWWSLSALAIALVIGIVTLYSWSRTSNLVRGPELTITSPDSPVTQSPLITLSGKVERVAHLRLNDGKIFADGNGHFSERLLLQPGYNIIKVEAIDRFGRQVERFVELAYQPDSNSIN